MAIRNCWDYLDCPEERKIACPAFTGEKGTECWMVEGTHCKGLVQGSMGEKIEECRQCSVYQTINKVSFGLQKKLLVIMLLLTIVPMSVITFFAVWQFRTSSLSTAEENLGFLGDQLVREINRTLLENSYVGEQVQLMVVDRVITETNNKYFKANDMSGYAFLLNNSGKALIHPTDEGKDLSEYSFIKEMLENKNGSINYAWEGQTKFLDYHALNNGWLVGVGIDHADLLKTARVVERTSIILGLAFIILGLAASIFMARQVGLPLKILAGEAYRISGGDLTGESVRVKHGNETSILANAFNEMATSLRDLVGHLLEKSKQIASSAGQLNASAQQCAAGANETSTTVTEINNSMEYIIGNIREVSDMADLFASKAREGRQQLGQITDQMQSISNATGEVSHSVLDLNEKSVEITRIVDLITTIAGQTNLLALNAAIEAARAGEQGRGFAVVAEEVRHLAEQTAGAAQEISQLVQANQTETERAVISMERSTGEVKAGTEIISGIGASLQEIIDNVENLSGRIKQMAAAVGQVSTGVESISALTEEQAAAMQQVSASAEMLNSLSEELKQVSERFHLN